MFCPNKTIIMYLKAKNFLHATRISSFKYVFIAIFAKKTDAKIYIYKPKTTPYNLTFYLKIREYIMLITFYYLAKL